MVVVTLVRSPPGPLSFVTWPWAVESFPCAGNSLARSLIHGEGVSALPVYGFNPVVWPWTG